MSFIITESPAKAKKIQGFLGQGYTVKSSVGHIRGLDTKWANTDVKIDRKLEVKDHFKHDKLRPANLDDINSYKVRKAKAGSYKEELNEEDIAYMNQQISERLVKEIGY